MLPAADTIALLEDAFGSVWVDGSGEELMVLCPYCVKRGHSPDKSGHLAINTAKNKAHCVRCDWGSQDAGDWLRKRGVTIYGLERAEMDLTSMMDITRGIRKDYPLREQVLKLPEGFEYFEDGDEELFFLDPYVKSMADKHIDMAQLIENRIGYCNAGYYAGYVVFPFVQRGKLVYWQGRAALPKLLETPKKKKANPSKASAPMGKNFWLYGAEEAIPRGKAVLCEGPLDKISLRAYLRKHEPGYAYALSVQGHTMSWPSEDGHPLNSQIGQLVALDPSEVCVLYDPDVREKSEALAKLLQIAGLNAYAGHLPWGDPNDFHHQEDRLKVATNPVDDITRLEIELGDLRNI